MAELETRQLREKAVVDRGAGRCPGVSVKSFFLLFFLLCFVLLLSGGCKGRGQIWKDCKRSRVGVRNV